MNAAEAVKETEDSNEFKEWKKANPEAYLTSAFSMFAEGQERNWLIGYYNSKKETITTFAGNSQKEEEAFKKEGDIPELKLEKAKISEDAALTTAKKAMPGSSMIQKTIMVLQNLKGEVVWNITFITSAFKVVNAKVSAADGKLISCKESAISDFMQTQ